MGSDKPMNRENIIPYIFMVIGFIITILTIITFYYIPISYVPEWYPDIYDIRVIIIIIGVANIITSWLLIKGNKNNIKEVISKK